MNYRIEQRWNVDKQLFDYNVQGQFDTWKTVFTTNDLTQAENKARTLRDNSLSQPIIIRNYKG